MRGTGQRCYGRPCRLPRCNGSDKRVLCRLVESLSYTEPDLAERYASRLEGPDTLHLDAEELESRTALGLGSHVCSTCNGASRGRFVHLNGLFYVGGCTCGIFSGSLCFLFVYSRLDHE